MGRIDNLKAYLGNSVYVTYDGYYLILTTENGLRETNRICLETEVYCALVNYVASLKSRKLGDAYPIDKNA
jgi:hypothetical protein